MGNASTRPVIVPMTAAARAADLFMQCSMMMRPGETATTRTGHLVRKLGEGLWRVESSGVVVAGIEVGDAVLGVVVTAKLGGFAQGEDIRICAARGWVTHRRVTPQT